MSGDLAAIRQQLRHATTAPEPEMVAQLLEASDLSDARREAIRQHAIRLVEACRANSDKAGTLDAFLQEFGLANEEGIALMCLAEALLRVPDADTADRLIAEKIHSGDWSAHAGQSGSGFVNAGVWGLMLTGKIVRLDPEVTGNTGGWMRRLVTAVGEPVVRGAMLQAMRIMGSQYVLGRSIDEAASRGRRDNPPGTRFSYDMLGEGARTAADADRYFEAYADAIRRIGAVAPNASVIEADGISVKLSALHPRFDFRHRERVHAELLPRAKALALLAKAGNMGFNIDAEEADRLDITLDVFEQLARDPDLAGWNGLGFVLQAYQKRSQALVAWLAELGRETGRRIMVRLVKGAYWDAEIKRAQELGLEDYPVFTRKSHTDLSYQVCAERLLGYPDAIYPQFATHNAHTVALILELARSGAEFEFQRLHGMGELLYDALRRSHPHVALRVYAPVGNHTDLLPYLVRRLLENGANSSFVNRLLDARVEPDALVVDPADVARPHALKRHMAIPVPRLLYRDTPVSWLNAEGIDLSDPLAADQLSERMQAARARHATACPVVNGERRAGVTREVTSPADRGVVVGTVVEASEADIDAAIAAAVAGQPRWDSTPVAERAAALDHAAELLEAHCAEFMALIGAEAGRTIEDALDEVREAVDFCRYYAAQARQGLADVLLPGPAGEFNRLSHHGRGVFVCISPWNFPLAIFTGQVVAALVTGNTVIAKPAEQTPLVAARAVELLHQAGIPVSALHLLPGDGATVGAGLVADSRIAGVAFTGGTDTARLINRQLAERDGPIATLIAETGGLNVMLVDATALPEQVVDDVIASAFHSAGQRCSALRVLYLQDDIAAKVLTMLEGAMAELVIGDPADLATDIGPVIDAEAQAVLAAHVEKMAAEAKLLASCALDARHARGSFTAPQVVEIERLDQLEREVFGPILHVIRYRTEDLPAVYEAIRASGYGLTLGVHSRIDGFAREVFRSTRVGNTYVNRNMIGAVVGVNPFGGQGLSGTGPKAGGPHYLARFITERTYTDNVVAKGGNAQLFNLEE